MKLRLKKWLMAWVQVLDGILFIISFSLYDHYLSWWIMYTFILKTGDKE